MERAEIIEKYQPGGMTRPPVLGSRPCAGGDYFSCRVHHDIDAIMEDIREARSGRSDSAPENAIVDELKRSGEL